MLDPIHYQRTHPDLFFNFSQLVLSIKDTPPARDAQRLTSHRIGLATSTKAHKLSHQMALHTQHEHSHR